jgi:hypothetical protein
LAGDERGEVRHLTPGDVVPQPGVHGVLLGCVRRHPGLRASDRLPRDNPVKLASAPENRRPRPGKNPIAWLRVVHDETRELHTIVKTPGIATQQLQHHRAALGKPKQAGR